MSQFDALSKDWWDKKSPMYLLYMMNKLRVSYLSNFIKIKDSSCLDLGCGGGFLVESLVEFSPKSILGVDIAEKLINVAKERCKYFSNVNYVVSEIHQFCLSSKNNRFDFVFCMELLEHIENPEKIFQHVKLVLKNGGLFFVSTINKNLLSYLKMIVGAEYLFNLVPKGTHQYNQFIKINSLLNWAEKEGFQCLDLKGMDYNPITKIFTLSDIRLDSNYIAVFKLS